MNILILGSKGFIGSHALAYFEKLGHKVFGCDVVDFKKDNYYKIDFTNADYNELIEFGKFDVCINCSGAASVPDSLSNPHKDFIANTFNVSSQLESIRRFSPNCKYINISSAAVYGNPLELPMTEEHVQNPISPYGVHKVMSEMICHEYFLFFNLPTISVRVFSVYGIGLRKQIFWDIYKKLLDSDKIELFGTGQETRDFIHVEDFVRALAVIIEKGNFNGNAINIGNGIEHEIRDLSKIISEIYKSEFNKEIEIKFTSNERTGDPVKLCADTSKISSLGYVPSVAIEDGLKEYYLWAKI